MRYYASALPWFIPGAIVSLLVAVAASGRLSRALKTSPVVATLLVTGAGLIISATLTPIGAALGFAVGTPAVCDISRLGPASLSAYLQLSDISLNVVLFVPLGLAMGLLPRSRPAAAIWIGAIASPFVIELLQLVLPSLGRSCQTGDVVDNLLGLFLGTGLGLIVSLRSN